MSELKFGSSFEIGCEQFGKLGAYPKDPTYVVLGSESGSTVPVYQIWRLDCAKWDNKHKKYVVDTSVTETVRYEQSFFLYNVSKAVENYVSDDKTSSGFDGADGYFGFTAASDACVFQLKGKAANTPVQFGDNEITLYVEHAPWKAKGKTLTVYPFNNWNYLVWDSPDKAKPTFSIDEKG